MRKIEKRSIDLSTGVDGVNDASLAITHTPLNYIPVGGSNLKHHLAGIDDILASAIGGGTAIDKKKSTVWVNEAVLTVDPTPIDTIRYVRARAFCDSQENWQLEFGVAVTCPSISRTTFTLTLGGVDFGSTSVQPVGVIVDGAQPSIAGWTFGSTLTAGHADASYTGYYFYGSVSLASKPTWADAHLDPTNEFAVTFADNSIPGAKIKNNSISPAKLMEGVDSYTEMTYDTGKLIDVDVWETSGKTTLLVNTHFTYDVDVLVGITKTDYLRETIVEKTFTYDIDGTLLHVVRVAV